jgi:hypothetical protein
MNSEELEARSTRGFLGIIVRYCIWGRVCSESAGHYYAQLPIVSYELVCNDDDSGDYFALTPNLAVQFVKSAHLIAALPGRGEQLVSGVHLLSAAWNSARTSSNEASATCVSSTIQKGPTNE